MRSKSQRVIINIERVIVKIFWFIFFTSLLGTILLKIHITITNYENEAARCVYVRDTSQWTNLSNQNWKSKREEEGRKKINANARNAEGQFSKAMIFFFFFDIFAQWAIPFAIRGRRGCSVSAVFTALHSSETCRTMRFSFISISLHFLSFPQPFPPARARIRLFCQATKTTVDKFSRGETYVYRRGATKLSAGTM